MHTRACTRAHPVVTAPLLGVPTQMSMDDIVVMIDGKKVKASAVGGGC